MTEFPTALAMLALGLALFLWFRNPDRKNPWILISGAILGFSVMIRTNPLFLIPFLIILSLLVYKFQWKQWFGSLLIFLCGGILAIGPWITYSQITYGTDPYTNKINGVLYYRFNLGELAPYPTETSAYDRFIMNIAIPAPQDSSETVQITIPDTTQNAGQDTVQGAKSKFEIITGHFLNNEIKAMFTLPFQLYPQDLGKLLDEGYWKEPVTWKGELPLATAAAFALNLALIALGIAWSWKKWSFSGLIPLMLNIGYYLSNAFGRTSGSRYLLPVDWTLYFYYILGILTVFLWVKNLGNVSRTPDSDNLVQPRSNDRQKVSDWRTLLAGVLVLLIGISIPLINAAFPKLYSAANRDEALQQITTASGFGDTKITAEQITELLTQSNGTILRGRMLYPRYTTMEETGQKGLFLTLLTPEIQEAFFPLANLYSEEIQPGNDIIVIGCTRDGYIDTLLGYIPETGEFLRSDLAYSETMGKCGTKKSPSH
jgi:hypothetical protein